LRLLVPPPDDFPTARVEILFGVDKTGSIHHSFAITASVNFSLPATPPTSRVRCFPSA
jgi:hypothetical protein